MAESKFDKLFRSAVEPRAPPKNAPRRRVEKKPPVSAARSLGRPASGKRSDPAWKRFSVLLKRETQREAAAILRSKDEGLDLSALVESLLESWIKRQKS
jgi:hypothetical protein